MADIYKIAAQNSFRFPSSRGNLTVEQLFALPLKSQNGFDLDSVARAVNSELKSLEEESFVDIVTTSPRKSQLETSLAIVKDVIKTKQEAAAVQQARLQRVLERKKILDAIGAKKDAALSAASLEELEKRLAELD